jgi:hypothetical protein
VPATPTIEAFAGDALRVHVLAPYSEQVQVFGIEGHEWSVMPKVQGANVVGSTAVGGLEALTIQPKGGAGLAGEYVYGAQRGPYRDAGLWGLLRVHPDGEKVDGLQTLSSSSDDGVLRGALLVVGAVVVALVIASVLAWRRRRRQRHA